MSIRDQVRDGQFGALEAAYAGKALVAAARVNSYKP
jgi:hypothetical protein